MSGPSGVHRGTVAWIDTDAAGIYHHTTVARYAEAAEAQLMESAGLREVYFPVAPRVRYEVDYRAPLRFGDDVTATVTLARLGTSSMTFEFEVVGGDGTTSWTAASGRYVTVHLPGGHVDGAAAVPWPEEWRAALESSAAGRPAQ
ncbi:acyl-CoA thioesterase [Nocardioides sp. GXZ039]|uniref:acyl-CoA thioesterase n=1 Tax=Nocardioides sp. GXZ039 TaxID=3136018 RepID=UPI0030F39FBD